MSILGISIGTTRTGVCILKDGVLLERNIHTYNSIWKDNKLRIITNRYRQYIKKYNVSAIIVKIPPTVKLSDPERQLLKQIEALAKGYYCEFDIITKIELKNQYALHSTSEIVQFTCQLYPELTTMFEKGTHNDHHYYHKVYEAILSAHIFQERLRIKAE